MKILNYMLKHLGNSVTNIQVKNNLQHIPTGIVLLDGKTAIRPGSICIGGQKEILLTIKNFTVPKETIFFLPFNAGGKQYVMPNINMVTTSLDMITLYNSLSDALISLKSSVNADTSDVFGSFFRRIIDMELLNNNEILSGMHELDYVSGDPYNIIVIEFMNTATLKSSKEQIKEDLLEIFPTSNITIFANRVVAMYQHPGRVIRMPEDQYEAFTEMLIKYDAHAGVSNHTFNFEMIRTDYIIAKSILTICKGMFRKTKRRVFTQEEHGTFYIMDLCYRQCEQVFHHSNMLYLCHPGLAALIRYDNEHNSNLRKVLMCYLLNDRSLSKTSKILFMHRNTTMNKINKITEIIDDDMDDALIRQRLLFSCLFYDYCEKYKQKTFHILPLQECENEKDK